VKPGNRRLTDSCINWIFAVKPKLENYHEHQSAISTIEDKRMTTEFPLSHLLSDLVKSLQELAKKSAAENWLLRLDDLLDKLQQISKQLRTSLSYVAAVRICGECSGKIRPWDRRVLVNEYTSIHRRCRESRQFFIEFMRWHFQLASGVTVLPQTPELLRATELIQLIVCSFYDEVQRNGKGSVQSEYIRGMLNGAKSMLAELRGHATKEQVLNEARRGIARPFPCALPLAEDGNRYGWDIEAEAGSP